MSEASDLINMLKNTATDAFDNAATIANNLDILAITGQQGVFEREIDTYRNVNAPNISAIPEPPPPSDFDVDFDAILSQIMGVMDDSQNSWILQYFPAAMPDGFDPLMTQILNGELITAAEQEILWERAKNQGMRDSARAEDEAVSQWASRGFSLPGGVVNGRLQTQQQDLFFANADFAAQQAIKAIDLRVDAVKFAADVGTRLRLGIINSLVQLVEAYARIPAAAAEYGAAVANAKRASYEAVAAYYRALIDRAEVTLRADIANASNDIAYINAAGGFIGTAIGHQVQAGIAASDVFARTAAASLGGLNGVASVVNQTTE